MSRLSGKVILVTGGSRGIGEAIVRRMAEEGAKVFATYNSNSQRADAIDRELGGAVRFIKADVADEQSVKEMVEQVLQEAGRVDVLINNAGITRDNLLMRMSTEDWDAVLNTNLKGAFLCAKAVCRTMMSQRRGKIINIGSVVGLAGNAGQVNYSSSKAGLVGLTKSLAKELSSRNILVNCIAPGYVETEMTDKLSEDQRQAFLNIIPLKRPAKSEELAVVVAFFASDDANYITGQVVNVDGGLDM
ncbi:MAG TPA: 3-oxoacyl-[acyl-carrier-protein] reductase [Patescibacteria group bacterium]|nr:3-oxoacyl-[acyl-carrier-protein] reductase [Patescibacteria group bacterium]